jgi:predicted O-methyltransferase YrrM
VNHDQHIWKNRASKAVQLLSLLPRRPMEFYDRMMTAWEVTCESANGFRNGRGHTLTFTDALSRALRVPSSDIKELLRESELQHLEKTVSEQIKGIQSMGPFDSAHNGNFCLARSIYVLCRLLTPNVVLETGVAYGVTSAFTLQALAVNRRGNLISVDLPPLARDADRHVGALVPWELRDRWRLHRGPAKRLLPNVITSLQEVDVFVHDSLHTYHHIGFELETAWPFLRPGGAVVVDNIDLNDAFDDFTARVKPVFSATVEEEDTDDLFGIMMKRV